MPYYIFRNPATNEFREIFQSMKAEHVYFAEGVKWEREFTSPQASIDTKIDMYSPKDFVEKSRNKKGTVGELWDASAELSKKREDKNGKDNFKAKYYEDYAKKRRGKKHLKAAEEGY